MKKMPPKNPPIRIVPIIAALTLALCAALAATAGAAGTSSPNTGYRSAKFKVTVKGVQTMVQQFSHSSPDICEPDDHSSGKETFTFHSPKPVIVQAFTVPGDKNPILVAGKKTSLPVAGKVTRSYTPRVTSVPDFCGDNGGGVPVDTQGPDCGTIQVGDYLDLEYSEKRRGAVKLEPYEVGDDIFKRCPGAGGGQGYPNVITETTKGKEITADLTAQDLFDPEFGKWISIARGTSRNEDTDYFSETSIRWEVSWTRLGGK